MEQLLDRRAAIGECWNAAGWALMLAKASPADGGLPGCRHAVSTGLALQCGERGIRHQAALLRLGTLVDVADTASA
mgnify:CR=1 FL=1|jgi:hypothetical protein